MSKRKVKPVRAWTTRYALAWPYLYPSKRDVIEAGWEAPGDSEPFCVEVIIKKSKAAKKERKVKRAK